MSARGEAELVTAWRKASASNGATGNCVEVAKAANGEVAMRNSRDPHGPQLRFTADEWGAFADGMSNGEFRFLLSSSEDG